ncbi:MAG: AAA family ATPase [Myxococcaceae bacterium]
MSEQPSFMREVDTLIRARYPLLYLVTFEEQRVDYLMGEIARAHGKELVEWSAIRGLRTFTGAHRGTPIEDTAEPLRGLMHIPKLTQPSLVLLKDFHRYLDDPVIVRALRELGTALKAAYTTVLVVAPVLKLPEELEKDVSVVDVPLPTKSDLMALLKDIARMVTKNRKATVDLTPQQAESLVSAAHGLTLSEAENAFAKAIARDNKLDGSDLKLILDEKSQVIRKSGLLEYFSTDQQLTDVGGLEHLKHWLDRRKNAFSDAAREFGLPSPKGLLLLGVQGCGKSLTAKAIATSWKLPLVRLDMGRIYSGLIGSSEENLRKAIRAVESLAPVVLWIDEVEKGLAGAGGGSNDTGVSARVFGTLLTWLQEKTSPVFVVATANRIESLPPELLRKGRFDEIFFVDLPSEAERTEIIKIQLARRKRDPAKFPVAQLAKATEQFSGAELEQLVIAGLYDAFADGVELDGKILLDTAKTTPPLAVTMAEDVARLREWARTRTRPAS